mgnify:CR=1 FL=1
MLASHSDKLFKIRKIFVNPYFIFIKVFVIGQKTLRRKNGCYFAPEDLCSSYLETYARQIAAQRCRQGESEFHHARNTPTAAALSHTGLPRSKLKLNGIEVDCVIGERPDERTRLQKLRVDVELEIPDRAAETDALGDTVDYAALAEKVRAALVAAVRELDPDNALHLNALLTMFEEGSWLVILPVLLVFPLLALLLMVVFAAFGWLLSRPLKEIAEKRRAHWDAMGKVRMLKAVRMRAVVIFGLGVLLSAVPVFGFLATVIALNLFVFSVLALYESRSRRIFFRFVMRFIKLTIFLVAILFSSIPFVGIVLLLPYVISFLIRTKKIR